MNNVKVINLPPYYKIVDYNGNETTLKEGYVMVKLSDLEDYIKAVEHDEIVTIEGLPSEL